MADHNTLDITKAVLPDVSKEILLAAQALANEFPDIINVDQAADIVEFIACGNVPLVNTEF